ncbi:hypothetical protein HD806DRAFT_180656 [Xylariaceae sp. AK1471]|nr:hypothetical protein HD806DRAFT_180656 [Xylariaceae sp. AK1471]
MCLGDTPGAMARLPNSLQSLSPSRSLLSLSFCVPCVVKCVLESGVLPMLPVLLPPSPSFLSRVFLLYTTTYIVLSVKSGPARHLGPGWWLALFPISPFFPHHLPFSAFNLRLTTRLSFPSLLSPLSRGSLSDDNLFLRRRPSSVSTIPFSRSSRAITTDVRTRV